MTCFKPLLAYRGEADKIFFYKKQKFRYKKLFYKAEFKLPCGQCINCRLERSRQWAVRCLHEAKLHDSNCFITLTYSDEFRPEGDQLHLPHFQLFMKKLRKKYGNGIRYFHCGEYTPINKYPHYHACIFGFDFDDRVYFKTTKSGSKLYTSKKLEKLWTFGYSSVGDVTFESAAYVARYICDKVTGKNAEKHYLDNMGFLDKDTGELIARVPEYTTMSRRPGIGSSFYDSLFSDIYPRDEVIIRGKSMQPPRYYDAKLKEADPGLFEIIKASRVENALKFSADNTVERLSDREKVATAKLRLFSRSELE